MRVKRNRNEAGGKWAGWAREECSHGGFWTKKDGTNGLACSCREASDANYFQLRCGIAPAPSLEYIQLTIDSIYVKYKNRNFYGFLMAIRFGNEMHLSSVAFRVDSVSR